jgi:negative regulator of flagellin synthesis FlgM
MKIDAFKNTGLTGSPRVTPKTGPTANPAAANPGVGDVRLSSASAALSAQEPEINLARVLEIRKAISEGRFEINPAAIADRLITTARELVDTRRQA